MAELVRKMKNVQLALPKSGGGMAMNKVAGLPCHAAFAQLGP
jgi:hypothetical protein